MTIWGKWNNGLRCFDKVRTPLGAHQGLGTQPCYGAPSELWVKIDKNAVINIELVGLSP